MKLHKQHFDSIEDFLKDILSKPIRARDSSQDASKRMASWFGGTWKQALEFVETGDKKTGNRVEKEFYEIKAAGKPILTEEYVFADEGLFIDVGTFLEGNPEYFVQNEEGLQTERKSVVTIMINCCQNAHTSGAAYFTRGAHTLNLIESLEKLGHPVEVVAAFATDATGSQTPEKWDASECTIVIKRSDQAVDYDKIAYCIANVSFFRRLMFRYFETRSNNYRKRFDVPNGYGTAGEIERKNQPEIYIPSSTQGWGVEKWESLIKSFNNQNKETDQ